MIAVVVPVAIGASVTGAADTDTAVRGPNTSLGPVALAARVDPANLHGLFLGGPAGSELGGADGRVTGGAG